jgi:subtilisin family serine protease
MPELELVKLPDGITVGDAVVKYMSDPNVEYAEPNYIRRVYSITPDDTYFLNQWGLNNTGSYAYGSDDADIDAPEAWGIIVGSQSVGIAVIDTGIDYNHADLVGNIWINDESNCTDGIDNEGNVFIDDCRGWDFTTCAQFNEDGITCETVKSEDNDPMDDNGHGTHVAGIIGARGNNGQGVTGVMWRVWLMPLKAFNEDGFGSDADIVAAINYAVAEGAKVINASWGGPGYSQTLYDAISAANSAGVLVVAAAGNGEEDGLGGVDNVGNNNDLFPHYPASFDLQNIISVAATDQRDERVAFSNYGPNTVDVAAPGVYIWSTVPNWWSTFDGFGIIETFSGTSMAAPHVSGLAGLLFGFYDGIQNTKFNHTQVRSTILRYGDWPESLNGWIAYGRINAYKALSSLLIPTDLTARAQGADDASTSYSPSINLSWTDNANGEDGYRIERKSDSDFVEIHVSGPESTSYNDPNLDPLTTYTYRVRAFNNNISVSMPSNDATETTLPGSGNVIESGAQLLPGKEPGQLTFS